MPTFRCPYCHTELGDVPKALCPRCGKAMQIPDHLRSPEERERRSARRRARRLEQQREETRYAATGSPAETFLNKRSAIMGVLLVLIILAGALLGGRSVTRGRQGAPRRTPEQRAMADLEALRVALERFRWDCRRYPTTEEGLRALVVDDGYIGWRGHYVSMVRPDPWQQPYVYRVDDDGLTLRSRGADRREGTDDDVVPPPPTAEEVAGPGRQWDIRQPLP